MIHRVAEPEGLVQRCQVCPEVVVDFSPPPGTGTVVITEARPSFFQAGQYVTLDRSEGVARLHEGVRTKEAMCCRS